MLLNTRGDECARLWRCVDGISGISFVPRCISGDGETCEVRRVVADGFRQ